MLSSDLCVWRNHARIFKKCIIYRNLLKKVLQNSWKKSLFLLFFLRLDLFPQAPPAWVVRWSKGRILSKLSLFFLFLYFPFAFELAMPVPYCVTGWQFWEGHFCLPFLSKMFKGNSTWQYFCLELEWSKLVIKWWGKKLSENG